MMIRSLIAVSTFALLSACSASDAPTLSADAAPAEAPQSTMPVQDPVMAALRHPDRPKDERQDDARRHVKQVLWFMGIERGMDVFEMEAGSGYYTEIMSRIVGPDGSVVMQNPVHFDNFIITAKNDGYAARLGDDRLPNVRLSKSNFDALDAGDGSMDIVTWILGPHELWFSPDGNVSFGDPSTAFAEAFRILEPGGTFLVIDHAADADAPPSVGGTLHRISPELVKNMAMAAGFDLADQSDILANADDDHSLNVFDEAIRRKTDRFMFKFVKPAE